MPIINDQTALNKIASRLSNNGTAVGYERLTVSSTAVGFTLPAVGENTALVIVESTTAAPTIALRYKEDGGAPTSSLGMPTTTGTVFEVQGAENMKRFKAIEAVGATTYLHITYYRQS